jgi:signal transduction histidine kinase
VKGEWLGFYSFTDFYYFYFPVEYRLTTDTQLIYNTMKMIKRLALITLLFQMFLYSCNSTVSDLKVNATNDSIKKYLDLAGNDTLDFKRRILFNDKAYSFIDFSKNDTLTRYNLDMIAFKYCILNKIDKLKLTSEKLMLLSIKTRDTLNIGRAHRNLGLYNMLISNNEKAIEHLFKAKKIFNTLQKSDLTLRTMSDISLTQAFACDFLGSNKTAVELLALAKKINYNKLDFFCYVKIGNNLSYLKNNTEAIKYLKKAYRKNHSKSNYYSLNNNLSESYIYLKKYDSALKYVNLNLNDLKLFTCNPSCYSTSLSLKAYIQLKTNNYANLERSFKVAEKYFSLSNSLSGRNYNQIYLSIYYSKIGDTIKAIKAVEKALSLSKSYKNPTDILTSLEQLIKVDKVNSSKYAQQYIQVNDSLQIAERKFRDKFARIKFETDEITHEKEKAIQQKWITTGVSVCIILITILILVITYQRSKQKELALLQKQQIANEELNQLLLQQKSKEEEIKQNEKKRIAIELHDGIMNKLSSTRLNLSILSHKKDPDTIQKCLQYINDIYQIEQDIRIVSHDLNHDAFDQNDSFVKILEDFIVEQNKTSTTLFSLEMDPEINWEAINSLIKINLYRIIQEGSQNIKKYAEAQNAIITFAVDIPNICMAIADNGIGFDATQNYTGIGLTNMATRVKSLNGKMNISSIAFQNTSISIAIPLENTI